MVVVLVDLVIHCRAWGLPWGFGNFDIACRDCKWSTELGRASYYFTFQQIHVSAHGSYHRESRDIEFGKLFLHCHSKYLVNHTLKGLGSYIDTYIYIYTHTETFVHSHVNQAASY